eukprot:sb/3472610/
MEDFVESPCLVRPSLPKESPLYHHSTAGNIARAKVLKLNVINYNVKLFIENSEDGIYAETPPGTTTFSYDIVVSDSERSDTLPQKILTGPLFRGKKGMGWGHLCACQRSEKVISDTLPQKILSQIRKQNTYAKTTPLASGPAFSGKKGNGMGPPLRLPAHQGI